MVLFIQSVLVYGLMILVMMQAGKFAYKHQYPEGFLGNDIYAEEKSSFLDLLLNSHFIIPILVFCLFATIRYKVGVDCETYKEDFYDILLIGKTDRENYEYGYITLIKLTQIFTNKHYLLFAIMSFVQISLLYYSMRKESYLLMFYGLIIVLTGFYFSLMNVVRQNIAAALLVALIPVFLNKKRWLFIIPSVIAAMLIHKSALFIIPLGIIGYLCRNRLLNINIQLILFAVSILLMNRIDMSFLSEYSTFSSLLGLDEEYILAYTEAENSTRTFGLRSSILSLNYIIAIIFSGEMNKFFNTSKFRFCYNLFFIGICLYNIFYNNVLLGRLIHYCTIFNAIILSYLLFYLWFNKNKTNNTVLTIIIGSLIIHILYYLYESVQLFPEEFHLYKFDF